MDDKFRIGSAAEFVKIHAEAFAIGVRTEGYPSIQQPEQQIEDRQDEAEECGDADKLGNELAALGSE